MTGNPTANVKRPPVAVVVAALVVLSVLFDPRVAFDALRQADSAHGEAVESAYEQSVPNFEANEPVYPASCLVVVQSDEWATEQGDEAERLLAAQGFQVRRVPDYQLGGSYVIYKTKRFETVARDIAESVGGFHVFKDNDQGYHFEGDVLVLVGPAVPRGAVPVYGSSEQGVAAAS